MMIVVVVVVCLIVCLFACLFAWGYFGYCCQKIEDGLLWLWQQATAKKNIHCATENGGKPVPLIPRYDGDW
jgi:hypothetical protein